MNTRPPIRGPADGAFSASTRTVIRHIARKYAEELTLDGLAEVAGRPRWELLRRFQQETGTTPIRWLWRFRVSLAAEVLLRRPEGSLTDVAFACGFTSSAHFSRTFRKVHCCSPSAFRRFHGRMPPAASASRPATERVGADEAVTAEAVAACLGL